MDGAFESGWGSNVMKGNVLELLVVCPARCGVDEATGDTGDEELVGNHELDGRVDLLLATLQHFVELLGLNDGTREAIEDKAMMKLHVISIIQH